MKLYVMFGQREEGDDCAPEALEFAWDEYCHDENPGGFEEALTKVEAKAKQDGFLRTKLFAIEVDGEKIHRLLNKTPTLKGEIEEP